MSEELDKFNADRAAQQEAERAAKKELEAFSRKRSNPEKPPNYVNPKRQEEAVKRFQSHLEAPKRNPDAAQKVQKGGDPESDPITLPFALTTSELTWSVSSALSSITDGTNGDAIDLSVLGIFDVPNNIAATKYIVLEADVDEDLVCTGWAFSAVNAADTVGVKTNGGAPDIQDKVRLLIGKVTVADGAASATQAVFTSQRLTHGFLNGIMVRVFASAPTHPDSL